MERQDKAGVVTDVNKWRNSIILMVSISPSRQGPPPFKHFHPDLTVWLAPQATSLTTTLGTGRI